MIYEIFDPRDGVPIYRVPTQWLARLLCRFLNRRDRRVLDYGLPGEGWVR